MKKKLRIALLVAAFAASGIVSFQIYWMLNVYRITEDNFNKTATLALQQSIDSYKFQKSGISESVKGTGVISILAPDTIEPWKAGLRPKTTLRGIKSGPASFNAIEEKGVLLLLSDLISKVRDEKIPLDSIKNRFAKALKTSGIMMPFELAYLKNCPKTVKDMITAKTGFSNQHNIIVARFPDNGEWLLLKNIIPIVVSFMLVGLSCGGFFYMLHVIINQRQLDEIKNDFISNMTHELQTPISILRSTHEALDQFGELKDIEKTRRYLKINRTVLDKLSTDIERVLDINEENKYQAGPRLENLNLKELTQEVIHRFAEITESKIIFKYLLESETQITEGYAIDTILSNLIENALKYGKDNGGEVIITIRPKKAGWSIIVEDNGQGIETKHVPFIFDKFYRVTNGNIHNSKGYGLGLNYVKKLTEMLKGRIEVSSSFGQGTAFILNFPNHEKN